MSRKRAKPKPKPLPGAMTVKQVRDLLAGYPDDMPFIVQKDGEGNGYSPLARIDQYIYAPSSTYDGELYDDEEIDEEEHGEGAVPALFLIPIN